MRLFCAALTGALVSAALFAATSSAVTQSPAGDTCAVNGNGTTYTVVISLGASSPEQGGFAFGVPGAKVTGVKITGTQGSGASTSILAPKTTAAWRLDAAAVPGASITASLTTSGPVTAGSFTLVPMSSKHTYLDAVLCAFPQNTALTPSNKFVVQKRFAYSSTTGTWHSFVTVPGSGKLNFNQKMVMSSGMVNPLVQSGKLSMSSAGKIKLTLKPTAAGNAALKKSGSIKLNLTIEFSPTRGLPANKLLTLTLTR
jgi:hypothetical protein